MSFPDDYIGLTLLIFAAVIIVGAWMDHFSMGHRHGEEDQLKEEVKVWLEAEGAEFVAINGGSGWRWVVDPWNPPWTDTKWESYYDKVFDTKRSGD